MTTRKVIVGSCLLVLAAGVAIGYTAMKRTKDTMDEPNASKSAEVWYTSESGKHQLDKQSNLLFQPIGSTKEDIRTFILDDSITYQPYFGMGSSLEESTVYNLMRMSKKNREKVLKYLMDPVDGLGWNVMRITLGTSDFTGREWYSYNDNPPKGTDVHMEHFSIQKDIDYQIVPVIKQALSYNPNLKIIASAWSVPAWMKDSGRLDGGPTKSGKIKSEYLQALALYYRKAIEAYDKQGIPIYAIGLQNEPGIHVDYPMTEFSLQQQIDFLKLLKKEFNSTEHGKKINTQVWVNEFNIFDWEQQNNQIYNDPEAYALSDGTSFHDYWGYLSSMSEAYEAHPDKPIYMTERSVWGTKGADRIIQYFRNYARSYNAWVTLLDSRGKPNVSSTKAGRTLVTINADDPDDYTINFESYMMGNFTKFIERGALRLESNYFDSNFDVFEAKMTGEEEKRPDVSNIAFKNPDGTIVMVIVNNSSLSEEFRVLYANGELPVVIPEKTVATISWKAWSSGKLQERAKIPTMTPDGGKVFGEVTVNLASETEGASIRYTLDGSFPTGSSELYTGPITLTGASANKEIKAITIKEGLSDSIVKTGKFEFVLPSGIPGQIEAEAYMATNDGQMEKSSEGGSNVGWIDSGDWMNYPVDVKNTGLYKVSYRIAGMNAQGTIELRENDTTLVSTEVENTGGWQNWKTIESKPVKLSEGQRILQIYFKGSGFNINWFKLEPIVYNKETK
ncbi:carbohydrate-binding protein [Cohnella luojiensis]|nr:carbohydrate-binding protein [Cohnella luojiensis]